MRDDATSCAALSGRNIPAIGRSLDQHLTGRRATFPNEFLRFTDSAAPRGEHATPRLFASEVLAWSWIFNRDFGPFAFELFRDQLGETRYRPRPISDLAIRITTVSSGWITTHALISGSADGGRSAAGTKGKLEAECEPSAAVYGADNETAAIYLRSVIHGILPLHAFVTA